MLLSQTPVLIVREIEPCLTFWVDRLGFLPVVEVPEGEKLGFVRLSQGALNIMYQSLENLYRDLPPGSTFDRRPTHSVLYIRVKSVDEVMKRLEGFPVVVPKRHTFYGATEVFYREPGGNIVGFAEFELSK